MITNLVNGKFYIGQTTNLSKRISRHFRQDTGSILHTAVQKYGKESFATEVLGTADDQPTLDNLEKLWIIVSNAIEKGYNLKGGGHKAKPSAESRRKMSESHKGPTGRKRPDTSERMKIWNKEFFTGRPSPHKGVRRVPEKVKVPKAPNGGSMPGELNPFWGKKHTPESLAKMSAAQKNRASTKGKPIPWMYVPEALEKKRSALVAYYATEEGKAAQKERARKRWNKCAL